MLTYSHAFYELKNKLQPLYDEREAVAIVHELLHHLTGLSKTQRLIQKDTPFTEAQQNQFGQYEHDLLNGVPLQYVTGSAWFMEREFKVNKGVLIPRPETEELVQWVVDDYRAKNKKITILDIGTGSGCIPVTLKSAFPDSEITAVDLSADALEVARENALTFQTPIQFIQSDFLDSSQHNKLGTFDVIISNPPYIPTSDKEKIHPNVKDHEPEIALFVPDDDALLFYRAIALFGKEHLNQNGYIYCELDAAHATECKNLFEQAGYKNVEIRKDMHGNWRMLRAE
jgi:release factor glutamine methyltransferase